MREAKNKTKLVGRPREFDEADTLTKIMNLFWEYGYEGTSLSDIMVATGLNKGSLYSAYGSKHDMYLKSIAHYELLVVDKGCEMLRGAGDAADKLDAIMSAPIDAVFGAGAKDRRGCFLCNASADRASLDKATHEKVRKGYSKLERALAVAVAEYRPDWTKAQVTRRARLLLTTYSGMRVMSRSVDKRATLEDVKLAALDF